MFSLNSRPKLLSNTFRGEQTYRAPDKIWPVDVCVMLDVRDIYFCVVFPGWPRVRDTALMFENVSTM